eukprot:CAMPEP_0114492162 /NCGR_PEP_ID=MMETSP0109-20121206/3400_1 /TAXON_ID=29199 /ORGANISM="Chlorarachnion reptans, Strain CCCM449" /LENGTH=250 /DNA_ID=CAMNT_0001668971 /DNA_START=73 /DNA_END=825 /DNA_ORIENTATION=-
MASSRFLFACTAVLGVVALVSVRNSQPRLGAGFTATRGMRSVTLPSRTAACATRDSRSIGDLAKQTAAGLALAGVSALGMNTLPANADVAGLTKCSESPAFKKRETKELKSLEKQLKKTPEGTPGYLELSNRIERTKRRFDTYGKTSLLCGPDGLPHLIVGPEFRGHEGEFAIPALGFLYTTGWIGWTGRKYIRGNRNEATKPTETEIILDMPRMTKAILGGAAWPFEALREYQNGDLTAAEKDVTVSAK